MYSPASLPLEHAPVASCSSKTKSGELEDSLLQLVQEHHHASLRIHKLNEKAKNDATKKAESVAGLLEEAVNGWVNELSVNKKRFDTAAVSQFVKRTDQGLSVTRSINTAIKEIGDFENWMKMMEFDSKSINAGIHNINQA